MRRGHVVYRLRCCYILYAVSSRDASLGIFTVAFGVVNVDEIAQDSSCARAYREGRYSRVVGFVFCVIDAAIAGDVRIKNNEMWT